MKKIKLKKKSIIIFASILLLVLGALLFFVFSKNSKEKTSGENKVIEKESNNKKEDPNKVNIVDLESKERPIAVMINTHKEARPQAGLSDAYMVYEIMVEGGITRMMALYTPDFDESKIGSIRSSRHNYLDYVMENDAIYVHWGGSDVAYNHLAELNLDRIDGMVYGNKYFTTDSSLDRSVEHTRFSSSDLIKKAIEDKNFRTTTEDGYLLNYKVEEIDLSKHENSSKVDEVTIKYSKYQTVNYKYNSEDQMYYRSMSGEKHVDLVTGEQYKFKNIIAYDVEYENYEGTKLQDLKNIGSGKGVYITNGYGIPIKWSKKDRASKTKYTYLDGTEIDVSDGNTFIQIYPKDGSLTIK